MIKKIFHSIFIFSTVLVITSCQKVIHASGSYETETRPTGQVTAIHSTGRFDIFLHKDTTQTIRVYAESGMLPYIITELKPDGTLNLRYRDYNVNYKHKKIEIFVPVSQVRSVDLQGSGSVTGEEISFAPSVNLNIGGSGNINLPINTTQLATNISGSGNIRLSGQVQHAKHVISGSGNLNSFPLLTESTNSTISGSGKMEVIASDHLKVNISGSGNVIYKGTPALEITISGSGKIIKSN